MLRLLYILMDSKRLLHSKVRFYIYSKFYSFLLFSLASTLARPSLPEALL